MSDLEVVVFPDAVALVRTYLLAELEERGDSTGVVSTVPNPRPVRFVRVHRVGGPRRNLVVDAATLAVECSAETETDAHDLAQLCRALLFALAGRVVDGVPIYRVEELGGPSDLPDPDSTQPRCVFTHAVHVRGTTEGAPS